MDLVVNEDAGELHLGVDDGRSKSESKQVFENTMVRSLHGR